MTARGPQLASLLSRPRLTEALRRPDLAQATADWKAAIVADLGGPERVSAMEQALVDNAARSWLILSSIDAWIFAQQRRRRQVLIDKTAKALFPVALQREAIARDLRSTLIR